MRYRWLAVLGVLGLIGCGTPPTTPTVGIAPTQTRAAELTQFAAALAPTATISAPPPTTGLPPTLTTVPTSATIRLAPTPTRAALPPTATNIPPTPTRPPTPRPPTATAAPQAQVATANENSYIDSIGNLWIIGEIINTGTTDVSQMQVAVSFMDPQGQTFASGSASGTAFGLIMLAPGEKTVWRALMNSAPKDHGRVVIQAQAAPLSTYLRSAYSREVQVGGVTLAAPARASSWVTATGQVTNVGTTSVGPVAITLAGYGPDDRLIAVAEGYAKLDTIAPGTSAPFSIDAFQLKALPATYTMYAYGVTKR